MKLRIVLARALAEAEDLNRTICTNGYRFDGLMEYKTGPEKPNEK